MIDADRQGFMVLEGAPERSVDEAVRIDEERADVLTSVLHQPCRADNRWQQITDRRGIADEPGNRWLLPGREQAETQARGYPNRGLPHVSRENSDQMSLRRQLLGQVAHEPALAKAGIANHQNNPGIQLSAERFPGGCRYN